MKNLKIFSIFSLLFLTIGCKQLDTIHFPGVKVTEVQGVQYDDLEEVVEIEQGVDLEAEVTFDCEVGFSYAELYLSNGTEMSEYLTGLDQKGENEGVFKIIISSSEVERLINNSVSIAKQVWVQFFVFDLEGNVGEGRIQFKRK